MDKRANEGGGGIREARVDGTLAHCLLGFQELVLYQNQQGQTSNNFYESPVEQSMQNMGMKMNDTKSSLSAIAFMVPINESYAPGDRLVRTRVHMGCHESYLAHAKRNPVISITLTGVLRVDIACSPWELQLRHRI